MHSTYRTAQIPADLITFTEEILNRKFHFGTVSGRLRGIRTRCF